MAEVTGLIPNQVFVNKILALSQLNQMQISFPKVVYDRTRIREWSNKVAGAIAVNGDIGGAAQYLTPPGVSYDAWAGLNATLETTMRMMGANEVTLGNIKNPDNTSAFIATRDAALVPLQSQQERFYAFIEEIGLIWLDFIRQYYRAGRMIPVEQEGRRVYVPLPDSVLDAYTMRLKVEVGPSSMWSEVQVINTLDNLLKGGQISLRQYLERMPEGQIPMKEELLREVVQLEAQIQAAQLSAVGGAEPMPTAAFEVPVEQPITPGVQALIEAVAISAETGEAEAGVAKAAAELARQGADADTIRAALKNAAEQGMIVGQLAQKLTQKPPRKKQTPKRGSA